MRGGVVKRVPRTSRLRTSHEPDAHVSLVGQNIYEIRNRPKKPSLQSLGVDIYISRYKLRANSS